MYITNDKWHGGKGQHVVIYNHEMHVIIDLGFSRIVQEYNGDSADRNLFYRLFISVLSFEIHLSRQSLLLP
jgi:hypothetical protein